MFFRIIISQEPYFIYMQMPYIWDHHNLLSSLCRLNCIYLKWSCSYWTVEWNIKTNYISFHRWDIQPFLQYILYNLKLDVTLITLHQHSVIPCGTFLDSERKCALNGEWVWMKDLWLGKNSTNARNESPFEGNEQEDSQRMLEQQDSTTELHE